MIAGSRVALRAWEPEDNRSYWAWLSDPEVLKMFDASVDQIPLAFLEQRYRERAFSPDFRAYGVVLLPQELIGWARWTRVREFGVYDVGLLIGRPDLWGKGYGREALDLLLALLFDGQAAHKVQATTFEFNRRSLRLFQSAGFQVEGESRDDVYVDGRFWKTIRLGLLRGEYAGRRGEARGGGGCG
ncbi:MAG: GNAT family N-acetyltransferase [Acetobacteraceae bacterium]|nr:GNAT family N-acetyltransferase [Acetobacteraceae bacterium]